MDSPTPEPPQPKRRRLAVSEVTAAVARVRSRIRCGAMLTALASALLCIAIAIVIAGLLDLSIGLGAGVRRVVAGALLATVVGVALWIGVRFLRVSQRQAAARVDAALLESGASGSEARSTLEFSDRTGASDLLSRSVAQRIAESAADRISELRTRSVRTGYRTGRAVAMCAAILVIAGAGQILAGDVVSSVGRRLLDPDGGHPRWSPIGVSIEIVRIDPSPSEAKPGIWSGDTVRIVSEIERMPEQVRAVLMVQREGSGTEPIPLDAVRNGDSEDAPYTASMTMASLTEPARVWVELRGGPGTPQRWRASSREIVLDPVERPRLRGARLTITPPQYTGLPERTIVWPGRRATTHQPVELPQGSRLVLDTRTAIDPTALRGPIDRPRVRLGSGAASIQWTQIEHGDREAALTLHGKDGAGDAVRLELTVTPDQPPDAQIIWPQREEVVALEGAVVPIRVRAKDDYAVDQATIEAEVVGDASRTLGIDLGGGSKDIESPSAIDTQAIGAVAGDVIEVYLVARDNRPDELGGSQTTRSRVLRILVVDPQQFAKMLEEEIGPEAAAAFEGQQQSESSGEPCPHCESGECEGGECQGGGAGEGAGSGQGSGTGSGQGSGQGSGSSSGGGSGSSGGGAESSQNGAGSNPGSSEQSENAEQSSEGQSASGPGDQDEQTERAPWQGDRFFDGRETEPADQQASQASQASQAGQGGQESAESTSESSTGPGGQSDDGSRTQPNENPVTQPQPPPFATDPDGRSGPSSPQQGDLPTEAENSVPERYRDLVRAYYERRSRSEQGAKP